MKIVLFAFSAFLSFFLFEKEVDSNFSYKNQLLVTDTIPPILNLPDTTVFYITRTAWCEKELSIIPKIEDETPFDSLIIQWALDLDNDGRVNKEGLGILNEEFFIGENWVKFKVIDLAGNSSEIDFIVHVLETDPRPKAVCYNAVSTTLLRSQNCEGRLYASDCDVSSFSCLSSITLKLNRVFDQNNNGIIDSSELATEPPADEFVIFSPDDLIGINLRHQVQLWVVDENGATDYCLTTVGVDAQCICNPSCDPIRFRGCIRNEKGDTLQDNTVLIEDWNYQELHIAGCFYSAATSDISDVTITPTNDSFSTTGISTFDIATITKHILNTELLDSPYKMIAADANNSKSITLLDVIAIRKVILRVENSFPNNSPWRFVPESFEFPNPKNPWETPFPETIQYNDLSSNWNFDFIGIQTGNMN